MSGRDGESVDDVTREESDRAESIAEAQQQQADSGDQADSYGDFKAAEADAMENAADEGQIFHKD